MQLGRYSVSTLRPPPIHSISFAEDGRYFAVAGEEGYEVWKSWPLGLVRRRVLPGTLALVILLPHSPLIVLQGGGASPLYSPNKAVIYHDRLGVAIAELEFGERIRGISARRGLICICLARKAIAFEYGIGTQQQGKGKDRASNDQHSGVGDGEGFWLKKVGEWETAENELGLMALSTSPGSSLLALPGRQAGHVQLISLPPCPPVASSKSSSSAATAFRSPIILAHTHALSTLSTTPTGSHLMTTSERGTLLRIWDTTRGRLERELRRGMDRAEMWGAKFDAGPDSDTPGSGEKKVKVVGWSDKGTVHVWGDEETRGGTDGSRSSTPTSSAPSLTHILSRTLPLPKYFSSTASFAQYHLPRKNPHAISTALGAAGVNVPSMKKDEDGEESERFVVGWVDVEVPLDPVPISTGRHTTVDDEGRAGEYLRLNPKGGKRPSGTGTGYNDMLYSPSLGSNTSMGTGPGSGSGIGMGTREERRSFGSDGTSRTATPPLRGGTPTPANIGSGSGRRGSVLSSSSNATLHRQSSISGSFINKSSAGEIPQSQSQSRSKYSSLNDRGGHQAKVQGLGVDRSSSRQAYNSSSNPSSEVSHGNSSTKIERQLIAITYSGDWYRLRIPPLASDESAKTSASASGFERDRSGTAGAGSGGGGGEEEERRRGKRCELTLVEYRRLGVGGGGW